MKPRAKKRPSPKGDTPKAPANPITMPAPIKGWWLSNNLSTPEPQSARVLDNWVCTTTGIRVRGGRSLYATLDAAVKSIFVYQAGATKKIFAATSAKIFNITSVTSTVVPAADITGNTSGIYSTVQFGTAGGNFLVVCNGTESTRNYDGTTWSVPAITVATSSTFSAVWSYANRLFFVQKDTQTAWYLPVDSIAGAAASFSLAGIFQRGGSLLFGARWSLDAGDGLDDKCVFVSTEGEVIIYEGINPAVAADWRKVGNYQMPRPMGRKAFLQAGGDLLIITEVGLIPISAAIQQDLAALEGAAVSRPISPYWQQRARELAGVEWEAIKSPTKNYMVVSQPDSVEPTCLVANLQTGGWSRFTGWDTQCIALFNDVGYLGSADFKVYQMEVGGSDNGSIYTCAYLGQAEDFGAPGVQKTVLQARPIVLQSTTSIPQLTFQANYAEVMSSPPSSAVNTATSAWDGALWDTGIWDSDSASSVAGNWVAIGRTGYVLAPELQLTYGVTPTPSLSLVAIDVQFSTGAVVA